MSSLNNLRNAIDATFGASDPPYGLIDRIVAACLTWYCQTDYPCCRHCPASHHRLFAGMGHTEPCRDLNCSGSEPIPTTEEKK